MRSWGTIVAVAIAAVMVTTSRIGAQWPSYPTPGVPRTADGKPVLDGPAPRTPDGKVDFSGVWNLAFGGGGGRGRGAGAGGAQPPAPDPNAIPVSQFFEVAGRGYPLPLQPWAAELKARRFAQNSKDHPDAHCLPLHPIQLHLHPQPRKIMQTAEVLLLIYEANDGRRQVFMDGRQLPTGEFEPWWYGYSVGRWEGDTLVVESNGFKDQMWLDEYGTPGSDRQKVTERFRRLNFGTLEIQVTVDDAKTFTRPFTFTMQQRLMPDTELIEFVCGENNLSAKRLSGN